MVNPRLIVFGIYYFFFQCYHHHRDLHSFPTRRSSDLPVITAGGPLTFCGSGSVTLTSSYAAEYLWSNGETTQVFCSIRSEEHTSELQSRPHLVCRLLLEKKNDAQ